MPGGKGMTIADITHPRYDLRYREWRKWRLTYHSGPQFIEQYLKQYTKREDASDFQTRKDMTYVPAFAKAAVDEVKNSIYQRMMDVTRDGGSISYQRACAGLDNGVDLLGNTMSSYLGQKILPELLTMGRVGVYVDMPHISPGETLFDGEGKRPYIYLYETEDIRSWTYDDSNAPNEFGSLLLRDYVYVYDEKTGLPKGQATRFRHYWIDDGAVYVQFYDGDGTQVGQNSDIDAIASTDPIRLPITRIPFVILELTDSLLTDIANYQIALLNLASSDLSYALKANFPFYTEQFNPRSTSQHLRQPGMDQPGLAETAGEGRDREIKVGVSQGRMYPVDTERPGFIHPSPEPLKASMEKQEQLKTEIRLLLNLAISNLMPRATSAEAKGFDERSLESGLSAIGLELEHAERMVASYWSMYENKKGEPASVKYPEKYNLKSDADRLKEAGDTAKLIPLVPSKTYSKEMGKHVVRIMLGNRIHLNKLRDIEKEIDAAPGMGGAALDIQQDVTAGILDLGNAAILRGYPPDAPKKAADEHAERLKRIQEAQMPPEKPPEAGAQARGVPDADGNTGKKSGADEKAESRDPTRKDVPSDATRGQGKGPRVDKVS